MAVQEKERKIFPTKLTTCDGTDHVVYIEYDQESKQTLYFRDPEGDHIFWPDGTMETAKKTIEDELSLRPIDTHENANTAKESSSFANSNSSDLRNSDEYIKAYSTLFMLTKAGSKKTMSLKINNKAYVLEMEKDENGKVKACNLNSV